MVESLDSNSSLYELKFQVSSNNQQKRTKYKLISTRPQLAGHPNSFAIISGGESQSRLPSQYKRRDKSVRGSFYLFRKKGKKVRIPVMRLYNGALERLLESILLHYWQPRLSDEFQGDFYDLLNQRVILLPSPMFPQRLGSIDLCECENEKMDVEYVLPLEVLWSDGNPVGGLGNQATIEFLIGGYQT